MIPQGKKYCGMQESSRRHWERAFTGQRIKRTCLQALFDERRDIVSVDKQATKRESDVSGITETMHHLRRQAARAGSE